MAKYKKLYKSTKDKWIAGVCAGIAEYFNIDPLIIRILWIFFTLIYGVGLIMYLFLWIVIPKKTK